MKILLKLLKALVILIIFITAAYLIYVPFENRKLIRNYLNVTELPSISAAECTDYGFTDALVKCYFEIDPNDFPSLFQGRVWATTKTNGCAQGPQVGETFEVTATSNVHLTDEKHGGSIDVCYGREMRKVLIHYYAE